MKNFIMYRYAEMALMLLGLLLFFLLPNQTLWKGIGIGLFMQASLMLSLDYFAEKRGAEYLQRITTLSQ